MDRSEIENQIDRLGLLANDDLLWPVALLWPLADTQGWEEKVTALRRATRKQKAKSLHRRASQLWQRLDEYATDPAFSKGQAIAKFLASKEERKIFYEHPYLRTDTAVGHLEKMALRAQEVNLPIDQQLPVELTCWNRAAAAEILKGTSSEQEKTLEEIRKEASGLLKQKGASMSLKFAEALEKLGVQRGHEDPRSAEPLLAAVRYKRALVDQGGAEPRIPLSSALKNFGVAEGIKKNHGKAEEALQEAADRLRSLVDENGLESRELLADTLMNLGMALSEQEEPQRAEDTYREAIKQFRALLEKRNVRRYRERLAEAYNKLGVEAASQEKYRESKQAAMAAAAQYQILFVERRATMKDRRWMAGAFRNFGKAARNLYYSDEEYDPRAERALRAAVDHYRAFFQKERTLQMRRELAETLDDLSKEHRLRSENEQAAESISEVASHFRVLFEKEEDLEVGKRLASALTSCGRTELLAKKFSEAENTLKAAADHIQSCEKFRMPERLALVWMTLGTAQFEQGKISEAEENLRKAVNLTGELPAPEPRVFQAKLLHPTHFSSYGESRWRGLSNLARCQVNKSKSEQSCGKSSEEHLQKAASYIGQAIAEIEEQRREMKDFHQRRALRAEYDFLYEDRRDIAQRLGNTETSLRWTSESKARGLSELIKASRADE